MIKKTLQAALIAVSLCACSEHDAFSTNGSNDTEAGSREETYSISQNDAVQIFTGYLNSFTSAPSTRGVVSNQPTNQPPSVKSVAKVSSSRYADLSGPVTRSGGERLDEVEFYELKLQNMDNTEGFAVVVGDKRFPEVVAYCPYGSISDTTHIEGLAMYFREMSAAVTFELNRQEAEQEPETRAVNYFQSNNLAVWRYVPGGETITNYCYEQDGQPLPDWVYGGIWYDTAWTTQIYGAGIPYRWHQWAPYNNKTPLFDGVRAPVGCVPLAMGTIMAHHKYPSKYNWPAFTKTESVNPGIGVAQSAISTMLYDVAVRVNTDFGPYSSPVWVGSDLIENDVKTAFQGLGYSCDIYANGTSHNTDIVIDNISRGLPVMMMANGNYGAHAFVVDAIAVWRKYEYRTSWANYDAINGTYDRVSLYMQKRREMRAEQLHCLWGWTGGMGNGWYFRLTPIDVTGASIDPDKPINFLGTKAVYYNIKPIN